MSFYTTTNLFESPKLRVCITLSVGKKELKLVTKVPSSNRDWKRNFFFVNGSKWVCSPEEVGGVQAVDCTWGVLPKSSKSLF